VNIFKGWKKLNYLFYLVIVLLSSALVTQIAYLFFIDTNEKAQANEFEAEYKELNVSSIEHEFTGDYYVKIDLDEGLKVWCAGGLKCQMIVKVEDEYAGPPVDCEIETDVCELRIFGSFIEDNPQDFSVIVRRLDSSEELNGLMESQQIKLASYVL